jgi:hypothetical protein
VDVVVGDDLFGHGERHGMPLLQKISILQDEDILYTPSQGIALIFDQHLQEQWGMVLEQSHDADFNV